MSYPVGVSSPESENPPRSKKSQLETDGLPDFSQEEIPDMSVSTSTGSHLPELAPEDEEHVEVLIPESDPAPAPAAEGAAEETDTDEADPLVESDESGRGSG